MTTASLKQQLADTRRELADTRQALNRHQPGRLTDGGTAWELWNAITDWLRTLDAWDWPTTNTGITTGTIGRTGHTDPTGDHTTSSLTIRDRRAVDNPHIFRPDREATHLLDTIQRALDRSITRTLGPDHQTTRPHRRPPSSPRPHCDCGHGPHATSWTHCPWTGQPL